MRREVIERPIELTPVRRRELLVAKRGTLYLPMSPQPVLIPETRAALNGELMALGYLTDAMSDAERIAYGFEEGCLPSLRCPYGRGGDLLWCREYWAQVGRSSYRYWGRDEPPEGGGVVWHEPARMPREAARLVLRIRESGIEVDDDSGRMVWALDVERQHGA